MEGQDNLSFKGKPRLRHPFMVCGTGGWVDGGESATGSIQYLTKKLGAKEFAEIPVDRFHIFQVPGVPSLRPHVRTKDGILREHRFPRNIFFYWRNRKADSDLILFLGTEPNLNWEEYANTILNLAREFEVRRIYLLGGYILVIIFKMYVSSFEVLLSIIRGDINPGIVHFRTRLKSDLARVILANSITLTPGTIALHLDDDHLIVHWLNAKTRHSRYAGELIKEQFEKLLKRIFI